MQEFVFEDFESFKMACYKTFSNSSFLSNIPAKADRYSIKMFSSKKELSAYIQNLSNEGKMFISLSGCIRGYNSKDDVAFLELGDMCTAFNEVVVGGCYIWIVTD